MAQDILAKPSSKSNLNSRHHLLLYQKVLITGTEMASLLKHYDHLIGLSKTATDKAKDWSKLMKQLAKMLL